jgi:hypothetical protein
VIHLGPPADELATERTAGIVGGLADDAEKALGAALDYAADFIAPPPPPRREQVRQMQKAAEEERQQEPARPEQAEQAGRFREILEPEPITELAAAGECQLISNHEPAATLIV